MLPSLQKIVTSHQRRILFYNKDRKKSMFFLKKITKWTRFNFLLDLDKDCGENERIVLSYALFPGVILSSWHLVNNQKHLKQICFRCFWLWSGLRGSNSLPPPWQGGALPDELNPHVCLLFSEKVFWCLRTESNHRHEDFQSSALPTELQRHFSRPCNQSLSDNWLATRIRLELTTSCVTGKRSNQLN